MDRNHARRRAQRGGAPVPAMRTIPVVLSPGKTVADDKELCERPKTFLAF
ncbi:hypothetical protein Plhal304r1_c010g0039831 [Plasmopara halstedii]